MRDCFSKAVGAYIALSVRRQEIHVPADQGRVVYIPYYLKSVCCLAIGEPPQSRLLR